MALDSEEHITTIQSTLAVSLLTHHHTHSMQCVSLDDSLCSTFTPIAFPYPISRPSWRCIKCTEANKCLYNEQFTEEKTWGAEAALCEWHANWDQGRQLSTSQPSNQITECRDSTLGTCTHDPPCTLSTKHFQHAVLVHVYVMRDLFLTADIICPELLCDPFCQAVPSCLMAAEWTTTAYTANVYMHSQYAILLTCVCCSCPADQSTAVLHQWHSSIRKGH